MTDMLLSAIAQSKDRTWLTRCGDYNLREGRNDVATAVDQRLRQLEFDASIKARVDAKTVEDRVKELLRVYRALLKLKHGRNQAAGYSSARFASTDTARRSSGPSGAASATDKLPMQA